MERTNAFKKRPVQVLLWMAASLGLLTVMLAGSLLVLGDALARVHPGLSWVLSAVVLATLWLSLVSPLVRTLLAPSLSGLRRDLDSASAKEVGRRVRQLLRQGSLSAEDRAKLEVALEMGRDPREPLREVLEPRIASMDTLIRRHAATVFVATAISQNGRLDAALVLTTNLRMIRAMVEAVGVRPSVVELLDLYAQVFWTALGAVALEEMEIPDLLGVGALKFVSSLLDATGNAFLTLRIGVLTKRYLLDAGLDESARRWAFREAGLMLIPVLAHGMKRLPAGIGRALGAFLGSPETESRTAVTVRDQEGSLA